MADIRQFAQPLINAIQCHLVTENRDFLQLQAIGYGVLPQPVRRAAGCHLCVGCYLSVGQQDEVCKSVTSLVDSDFS